MALFEAPLQWQRSRPSDPNRHSLVTLPTELRNQVLEYLLVRTRTVRKKCPALLYVRPPQAANSTRTQHLISADRIPPMALLSTCKQIHAEGASVFYTCNKFSLEDAVDDFRLGEAKLKIHNIYAPLIRHAITEEIFVDMEKFSVAPELRNLAVNWPNLKTLTVKLTDQMIWAIMGSASWEDGRVVEHLNGMYAAYAQCVPSTAKINVVVLESVWADWGQCEEKVVLAAIKRMNAEREVA